MKTILFAAVLGCTILTSCTESATPAPATELIYIDKSEHLPIKITAYWNCRHLKRCSTNLTMLVNNVRHDLTLKQPNDTITVGTAHYGDDLFFIPRQRTDNECPIDSLTVICGHNNSKTFVFSDREEMGGMRVIYNK